MISRIMAVTFVAGFGQADLVTTLQLGGINSDHCRAALSIDKAPPTRRQTLSAPAAMMYSFTSAPSGELVLLVVKRVKGFRDQGKVRAENLSLA